MQTHRWQAGELGELQAADADAARRVAALRAELDAVQADRARLHGAMLAAAAHDAAPPPASSRTTVTALAACALLAAVARSGRTIVGFDLCEVAPGPDGNEWDGNVGARLLYKMVGATLRSRGET